MYAVVNIGGKQAKVEAGSLVALEKIDAAVGEIVSLPVLMVADGDRVWATPAEVSDAAVSAEVLEHFKGEKKIVFKFKKRKGYRVKKGHRQLQTAVRVLSVGIGDTKVAAGEPAVAEAVAAE